MGRLKLFYALFGRNPTIGDTVTDWKPDKKVGVGAGAIGIPAGVIIAWALTEFLGVDVPETVAVAFGGVVSFLAAYLLPPKHA